jgi:hypothetical protein
LADAVYLTQAELVSAPQAFIACIMTMSSFAMSSFGPFVALSNLGSTLQTTHAAGRRVLALLADINMDSLNEGKFCTHWMSGVASGWSFSSHT